MNILAVIPARGGSKGVPNKNLKMINGISLVGIAIKSAIKSDCFSKVHVSTDSLRIQKEALLFNADCSYLRPKEISQDYSKTVESLKFCLSKEKDLGFEYDAICELQPTYVFRGFNLIKNCISKFIQNSKNFNSLVTISNIQNTSHPDYVTRIDSGGNLIYGNYKPDVFCRHELSDFYSVQGCLMISNTKSFLKSNSLFNSPSFGYEVKDRKRLWDINQEEDLEIAEYLASKEPNIIL